MNLLGGFAQNTFTAAPDTMFAVVFWEAVGPEASDPIGRLRSKRCVQLASKLPGIPLRLLWKFYGPDVLRGFARTRSRLR